MSTGNASVCGGHSLNHNLNLNHPLRIANLVGDGDGQMDALGVDASASNRRPSSASQLQKQQSVSGGGVGLMERASPVQQLQGAGADQLALLLNIYAAAAQLSLLQQQQGATSPLATASATSLHVPQTQTQSVTSTLLQQQCGELKPPMPAFGACVAPAHVPSARSGFAQHPSSGAHGSRGHGHAVNGKRAYKRAVGPSTSATGGGGSGRNGREGSKLLRLGGGDEEDVKAVVSANVKSERQLEFEQSDEQKANMTGADSNSNSNSNMPCFVHVGARPLARLAGASSGLGLGAGLLGAAGPGALHAGVHMNGAGGSNLHAYPYATTRFGRKLKGPEDYAAAHRDDLECRLMHEARRMTPDGPEDTIPVQVLICKFCRSALTPKANRISEHLQSVKHGRNKSAVLQQQSAGAAAPPTAFSSLSLDVLNLPNGNSNGNGNAPKLSESPCAPPAPAFGLSFAAQLALATSAPTQVAIPIPIPRTSLSADLEHEHEHEHEPDAVVVASVSAPASNMSSARSSPHREDEDEDDVADDEEERERAGLPLSFSLSASAPPTLRLHDLCTQPQPSQLSPASTAASLTASLSQPNWTGNANGGGLKHEELEFLLTQLLGAHVQQQQQQARTGAGLSALSFGAAVAASCIPPPLLTPSPNAADMKHVSHPHPLPLPLPLPPLKPNPNPRQSPSGLLDTAANNHSSLSLSLSNSTTDHMPSSAADGYDVVDEVEEEDEEGALTIAIPSNADADGEAETQTQAPLATALRDECDMLRAENARLRSEVARLQREVCTLPACTKFTCIYNLHRTRLLANTRVAEFTVRVH